MVGAALKQTFLMDCGGTAMKLDDLRQRKTPLELNSQEFRTLGYRLVDRIAGHFETLANRRVTSGESPEAIRHAIGSDRGLPPSGTESGALLDEITDVLLKHSLFNAHPRFWGYITAGPAQIGVLADLLAAAVNSNVGAWKLAPAATEIEAQTVRWIAEFIGYPVDCGGLMVSGGNMANFVCFLAARRAKTGWDVRQSGLAGAGSRQLRIYASSATHTWLQKAADLFGHGTDAIRWIETDRQQRLDIDALKRQVRMDRDAGDQPFLVVGNAGTVGCGAVDPLSELVALCREYGLWFHVDGAYGACAANVPGSPADLAALKAADSISIDPHKWLYAPLEAGCALVRKADQLSDAFSYHPEYYHFENAGTNYFDLGMQNSRGFRALKVWTAFRQVGRDGYLKMIGDDIRLARHMHSLVAVHPELEALSCALSIVTLRYVPVDLRQRVGSAETEDYLKRLNTEILSTVETSGEAFISNTLVDDKFALRACIVNFRTSLEDVEALPELIVRIGRRIDAESRAKTRV
jgi:glutamate/tyrosine decarboxylase-like PLP-dependent enzyme